MVWKRGSGTCLSICTSPLEDCCVRKPQIAPGQRAPHHPPPHPHTRITPTPQDELQVVGGLGAGEAANWAEALTFHHQWMLVSREHAAALYTLRKDIIQVRVERERVLCVYCACVCLCLV